MGILIVPCYCNRGLMHMANIRAFVGHSFTKEDEQLVQIFLDFFSELEKNDINFTWCHAKEAETKDLAEKVITKMKEKNLFIGICTKKEMVIDENSLKKSLFSQNKLSGEASDYSWKTSDWIIQEIGLAIGLGLEVMLLVEDGVVKLGGLQGNHERIPFNRGLPHKAFQKILETIRSINPKPVSASTEIIKSGIETEEVDEPNSKGENDWLKPEKDWERFMYEFAFRHFLALDNEDQVNVIDAAYLNSEEAKQPQLRESWEAAKECFRTLEGKNGSLSTLEVLAKESPDNPDVLKFLAKGYAQYDTDKAAELYRQAANKAGNDRDKLLRYSDAVNELIKSGDKKTIREILLECKRLQSKVEDGEELHLYLLRRVAEHDGNMDRFYGLSERLLQLDPDNNDARFKLAYSYSEEGHSSLSLLHYLNTPPKHRGAIAWNNLGAEYEQSSLVSKSVEAYRESEARSETLAMSNLAYRLLKCGFVQEAEDICAKALKEEDCHKNVSQALARIREVPEEESTKEKEIIGRALPLSEYYKEYGRAILQEDAPDYEGMWKGPNCDLKVLIKDKIFVAEGQYELPAAGLGLLQSANTTANQQVRMNKYSIRYEGIIDGHSVQCKMTKKTEGSTPTLLGGENEITALMVLSQSMQEISVYENGSSDRRKKTYKLTLIE